MSSDSWFFGIADTSFLIYTRLLKYSRAERAKSFLVSFLSFYLVFKMDTIPKILLAMFEHESVQTRFVLSAAKDIDLEFTPKDELRPLIDLVNHLAQIPIIDFKFFTKEFESFPQVREMEKDLRHDNIEALLSIYDQGLEMIKEHFSKLSDDDVLENKLKGFYQDGPDKNWAHYLPEITTHLAMHKMQLWMYLKLAGAPVSMWTYYGVPQSE